MSPNARPPAPTPRQRPPARGALRARLRDARGFMLAEQLVSIIFIGLLGIMVAAGLSAAMSAYANITRQTQADQMLAQAVERVSDELAFAEPVGLDATGAYQFISASMHQQGKLQNVEVEEGVEVERGIEFEGQSKVLLVAAAHGLVPSLSNIGYDETTGAWTFLIQILPEHPTDTTVYAKASMTVKRIG